MEHLTSQILSGLQMAQRGTRANVALKDVEPGLWVRVPERQMRGWLRSNQLLEFTKLTKLLAANGGLGSKSILSRVECSAVVSV